MSTEKRRSWAVQFLRRAGPWAPVVIIGALILIAFGGKSAVTYTSTPQFCGSCHRMTEEYASWQASPHAEHATCIECHSDPGSLGELAAHVKGIRMLYMTVANVYPTLVMSHQIPNSYCEKCHRMEDEKAKGVMVSHKKHLDNGVSCQDCHAGLVHQANEFKPGNERFHNLCQSCHDSQGVVLKATQSTSCTACHGVLTKVVPEDHQGDWMAKHGKATTSQNCGECHLAGSAGPHGAMSNPASFLLTKPNDQCAACHQTTMPHPAPYLVQHGTDAIALGPQVCAACHSPQTPANIKAPHTKATYCSDCHSGVAMPHPKEWLADHGRAAGVATNPVCITCHSSANRVRPTAKYAANDYCISCHNGLDMPHTTQFTATHGQLALKAGISCLVCHSPLNPVAPTAAHSSPAYCAACHDQSKHKAGWVAAHGAQANQTCYTCHSEVKGAKNSCLDCHQGKPGEGRLFHPEKYWFFTHPAAVKAQGQAACMKCHSEIQPSCSACHTNR